MVTIYYVSGYSSWNNKEFKRAFKTIKEANNCCVGLTEPKIYGMRGKSIIEAANKILMSLEN